jgi:hypothetical protein
MKNQNIYWIIIVIVGIWLVLSLFSHDEVKLGNNYIYDTEHQHILGTIDIPPVVKKYKYNRRFIVAKQSPKNFDDVIYDKMKYNYYLGRDTIYYWIIDKQTGKVFGPIDYNKFISLLSAYNAPKDFYNLENDE